MPDWRKEVAERLAGLALREPEASEVIEELAGHLDEGYRFLRGQGVSEDLAVRRTLDQAGDWQALERNIVSFRREESIMNARASQFWLPALLTLFLASAALAVIERFGPAPRFAAPGHGDSNPVAVVYLSWLFFLPVVGALGAYLSRRAGGSRRAVLLSVLFPVLPYLALFVIGLPAAALLDGHVAHNITLRALLIGLSAWVILPAAALLSGGLTLPRLASRSGATHA
jgi:hypothetical protein